LVCPKSNSTILPLNVAFFNSYVVVIFAIAKSL
jgi:hypothetical protein